jgi:hypothetical protein
MTNRPLFSILHSSARPEQWRKVYDDWMQKAAHPEQVEYVLCVDPRWGFAEQASDPNWGFPFVDPGIDPGRFVRVVNEGRKCYVDGVNTAARASSGSILIVNADDQFACDRWDEKLIAVIQKRIESGGGVDDSAVGWYADTLPWVVSVSTGTPDEHERGIMVLPILSRKRLEHQGGNVFFPEYESMFADNDFCESANHDGIVIDARHLMFPHRHPLYDHSVKMDAVYAEQSRAEAWQLGESILARRRASAFGKRPIQESKVISICIAGEQFSMTWVLALMGLKDELMRHGWTVAVHSAYTTNVFITRMLNAESVLGNPPRADYVLWIDDDNIVNYEHVSRLIQDLEIESDAAAVAGWCWIVSEMGNEVRVSCGNFSPDGAHLTHFDGLTFSRSRELRPVEWTGFPCLLMRYSLLESLGPRSFLPILDPGLQYGMSGEDAAFCKRAIDAGNKLLVDPRVKVQHVKPRAIEPIFPDASVPKPRVAAMLRVRNESRWIGRVIESLKPLCENRIFVLDDESTDDTISLALSAGAKVRPDPFPGQPLDEARDKNWLAQKVVEDCAPEWIFCIDGDEELEPLGAEKIFSVLRSAQCDMYAVRFLYLWDSPEQFRSDRWYSTFSRQSLFRADLDLKFSSLYAAAGVDVHSGLHVGNAPGGARGLESALIHVFLLHYGYMDRADRIRKYEYYNRIDPNNPMEDSYRHIVQGDIPEVPAAAVLKHAGPLELRKLPRSIAPTLHGVVFHRGEALYAV